MRRMSTLSPDAVASSPCAKRQLGKPCHLQETGIGRVGARWWFIHPLAIQSAMEFCCSSLRGALDSSGNLSMNTGQWRSLQRAMECTHGLGYVMKLEQEHGQYMKVWQRDIHIKLLKVPALLTAAVGKSQHQGDSSDLVDSVIVTSPQVTPGWKHQVDTFLPSIKFAFDCVELPLLPTYIAVQREVLTRSQQAKDCMSVQRVVAQSCSEWINEVLPK